MADTEQQRNERRERKHRETVANESSVLDLVGFGGHSPSIVVESVGTSSSLPCFAPANIDDQDGLFTLVPKQPSPLIVHPPIISSNAPLSDTTYSSQRNIRFNYLAPLIPLPTCIPSPWIPSPSYLTPIHHLQQPTIISMLEPSAPSQLSTSLPTPCLESMLYRHLLLQATVPPPQSTNNCDELLHGGVDCMSIIPCQHQFLDPTSNQDAPVGPMHYSLSPESTALYNSAATQHPPLTLTHPMFPPQHPLSHSSPPTACINMSQFKQVAENGALQTNFANGLEFHDSTFSKHFNNIVDSVENQQNLFRNPDYLNQELVGRTNSQIVRRAQIKIGPERCNLFIYHLPNYISDDDLAHLFAPFGPILSATIFVDRKTLRSKCFGFVSYSNQESASRAIGAMNNCHLGDKLITVCYKREKGDIGYDEADHSNSNKSRSTSICYDVESHRTSENLY